MKKWIVLALLLGVLLCTVACGETAATQTAPALKQYATGRYELEKITYSNGTVTTGDSLVAAEIAMGDMYVELYSDNTALLSLLGQLKDMEFSSTKMWRVDNTMFSYGFSVSNGRVALTMDGDTYIFVKK